MSELIPRIQALSVHRAADVFDRFISAGRGQQFSSQNQLLGPLTINQDTDGQVTLAVTGHHHGVQTSLTALTQIIGGNAQFRQLPMEPGAFGARGTTRWGLTMSAEDFNRIAPDLARHITAVENNEPGSPRSLLPGMVPRAP